MPSACDSQIKIRSSLPGRVRFDVPALFKDEKMATQAANFLSTLPGIVEVCANPVSSRVLVQYQKPAAERGIVQELAAFLRGDRHTPEQEELEVELLPRIDEIADEMLQKADENDVYQTVVKQTIYTMPLFLLPIAGWQIALASVGATYAYKFGSKKYKQWKQPTPKIEAVAEGKTVVEAELLPSGDITLQTLLYPHRKRIALASACSFMNKIFDLLPPVVLGSGFNVLLGKPSPLFGRLGLNTTGSQILAVGTTSIVVWALDSMFEYIQERLWHNIAEDVKHEMRTRAYTHVQSLDMDFFENASTGQLLKAIESDADAVGNFLRNKPDVMIQTSTGVAIMMGLFATAAPGVALVNLASIPAIFLVSKKLQNSIGPKRAAAYQGRSDMTHRLASNLAGINTIKNFSAEKQEAARVELESKRLRDLESELDSRSSMMSPSIRMVVALNFAGTFMWGAHLTSQGRLSPGLFTSIMFLSQRMLWPLTSLGEVGNSYNNCKAALERHNELMQKRSRIISGTRPLPKETLKGTLDFFNVSFSYDGKRPTLSDISLRFEAGKTTAIVGPTGSGKTTLIKLLLRFYDPSSGHILLDGVPISEYALEDLRGVASQVSQDVFLFYGTIRENIAFGKPDASEEEIVHVAKIVQAHDFIMQLPEGYNAHVGESGGRLSGGQRQRIAIARTLLSEPPILILDEATSAFDRRTEVAFYEGLEALQSFKTRIVIAHRLFSIRDADWIYVLDDGCITEQGNHDQLMRNEGLYAAMWHAQTNGHRIRVNKKEGQLEEESWSDEVCS